MGTEKRSQGEKTPGGVGSQNKADTPGNRDGGEVGGVPVAHTSQQLVQPRAEALVSLKKVLPVSPLDLATPRLMTHEIHYLGLGF